MMTTRAPTPGTATPPRRYRHGARTPRETIAWVIAVAMLPVLWTNNAPAQEGRQTVDLRPKFVDGQTSRYSIWSIRRQNQTVTTNGESRDFETVFEIEGEVTWAIDRVRGDGSAVCSMTIDWMTAQLTGPDGKTKHSDSRRRQGEPEGVQRLLRAVSGQAVRIEVAPDGSILSAGGLEAMKRRADPGTDLPDELDFIESASELATLTAAPAEATVGGGWDTRFRWNHQLGKLVQAVRYEVESTQEIADIPTATVTGSATLTLEPDVDKLLGPLPEGTRVNARMISGRAESQVIFDLFRHEAVGRNTTEDRDIEVKVDFRGHSLTRRTQEQVQSQVLRLSER